MSAVLACVVTTWLSAVALSLVGGAVVLIERFR